MPAAPEPIWWERRGSSVYTEGDGPPGSAKLVAALHPAPSEEVQRVVDAHNACFEPDTPTS